MKFEELEIAYEYLESTDAGAKERIPFVLLHGIAAHRGYLRGLAEALLPFGDAILIDLVNHGETLKRSGLAREKVTHQYQAEAVREVLENLGVTRVFVVGHSYGAGVGAHLSLLEGIEVGALFLAHPWIRSLDDYYTAKGRQAVDTMFEPSRIIGSSPFGNLLGPWEWMMRGPSREYEASVRRENNLEKVLTRAASNPHLRYQELPLDVQVQGGVESYDSTHISPLLRRYLGRGGAVAFMTAAEDVLAPAELVKGEYDYLNRQRVTYEEFPGDNHLQVVSDPQAYLSWIMRNIAHYFQ